jgi:hypothetical protein
MPVQGCVPDAPRLADLLAARLVSVVRGVEHAHDQLLRTVGLQRIGDVERERVVAAAVLAHLLAVDPDARCPVDGLEVQQHAPPGRPPKRAAIPEPLGRLHHPRQGRLDRKGHEDAAGQLASDRRRLALDGARVLPQAVQAHPLRAHHLRPGVLGVYAGRVDAIGPGRFERPFGGLPSIGRLRSGRRGWLLRRAALGVGGTRLLTLAARPDRSDFRPVRAAERRQHGQAAECAEQGRWDGSTACRCVHRRSSWVRGLDRVLEERPFRSLRSSPRRS